MKINIIFLLIIFIGCNKLQDKKQVEIKDIMTIKYKQHQSKDTIITNLSFSDYNINMGDSIKLYYFEGNLKQVSQIQNGETNGSHIEFRKNGNLYFSGKYSRGIADGLFKDYDSTGKLSNFELYISGSKVWDSIVPQSTLAESQYAKR